MTGIEFHLENESATEELGARLAHRLPAGTIVFLHGQLGAGKTTLVRGFLRERGYGGPVKSPTYTLVEPYSLEKGDVFHFDLYRLADPEELEYLGGRDYFDGRAICFVEWPERGAGMLPSPDLEIHLFHLEQGRRVQLRASNASLVRDLP